MHFPPDAQQLLGLAQLLGLGLLLLFAAIAGMTLRGLVRPPRVGVAHALSRGRATTPAELDPPLHAESWTFTSRGRELPVWDVRGLDPRGPVVIVTHGWGEDRVFTLPRVAALAPACSRLVTWDLPGHGEAPGSCTLGQREPEDLAALVHRVRASTDRPLVLCGSSMGAGISIAAAAALADDREHAGLVSGVIAECPYRLAVEPARNVLRLKGMPSGPTLSVAVALLGLAAGAGPLWRRYDRERLASRLRCPLLVLHGAEDAVSPPEDGRRIAAAAPDGTFVPIEGAGHVALWAEQPWLDTCRDAATSFLRRFSQRHPAPASGAAVA